MIPPRVFPPGHLALYEVTVEGERNLIEKLPTSSKNRERINLIRNDLLIVDPTKKLEIIENNAV